MRDIASEEDGYNISLEANGTVAVTDDQTDEDDFVLEDICEVVISLKCKKCQFLCNDKSTLATHIKQIHSKKTKTECNSKKTLISNTKDDKNQEKEQVPIPKKGSESSASVIVDAKDREKPAKYSTDVSKKLKRKKESYRNGEDGCYPATTETNQSASTSSSRSNGDVCIPSAPESTLQDDSVEDVFLCAECDIVFSSREMCCSHMHEVHGLNQFSADFIQEEIISKPTEEAHNSKKGRKTKFPKQFATESGAIVPKKFRVTKDVFHTCSKCPIKFESAEVMKFHEQCHLSVGDKFSHENVKKEMRDDGVVTEIASCHKGFICPVCESNGVTSQLFPKWGPCSWHLWKEHRIDCELYTCSVCKQFKSHLVARVKDHEQLHSTKSSYKCKTCNKSFKQMKQLRCHEKYHKDNSTKLAPKEDSRWYTPKECPICQRILSDSKCLKKHISAVHNKLKPYGCDICGHTSARKAELQLHLRQHTGEKPYKCPMCEFQTGDHNSLRKHKLRHSDERPYACSYCDYRCIQSCAFKKHILACHPGQEVVFLCQLCSHASVNETSFLAHQKDHVEGRITAEPQSEPETSEKRAQLPSTSRNSGSRNGSRAVKYWSGDEDSLDIIDNDGVRIPTSPPPLIPIDNCNLKTEHVEKLPHKVVGDARQKTPSRQLSQDKGNGKISKRTRKSTSSKSHTVASSTTPKANEKEEMPIGSILKVTSLEHEERHFLVPQGFRVTTTSTLQQTLPASPRPEKTIVTTNSTNTTASEDTESSSSEVITNPHQLIQNIQLTPLDLTDIISCNEQSNDDGMLQRLLDMSGV